MPLPYKLILTVFLFILSLSTAFGQSTIKGRVVSAANNEGLPYATISLPAFQTGVIADMDGNFALKIPDAVEPSGIDLSISMIGYITTNRRITTDSLEGFHTFSLEMAPNNIDIVQVKETSLSDPQKVNIGNSSSSKRIITGWSGSVRSGGERGILVKPKKNRTGYINAVNFHIANCTLDSVKFQLLLYSVKEESFTLDNNEEVFIVSDVANGWIRHEYPDWLIELDEPKLVMIRVVETWSVRDENQLHISGGYLNSRMYYRWNAGAPIEKSGLFGVSINVDATLYREGKD